MTIQPELIGYVQWVLTGIGLWFIAKAVRIIVQLIAEYGP